MMAISGPEAPRGARKIRLMHFLVGFGFGGTERQVANLVRGLDLSRFELHTGCLKAIGHLADEFQARAASLTEYKIDSLYDHRALKQLLRLAADIRRRRIDIVHAYGLHSNVFAIAAARLAGAPVAIASIRDMGDVWTPLQNRVQRAACGLADHVVVNAEATRQRLVNEGYDPQKISVIVNGVVVPGVEGPARALGMRQEFALGPRAPLVALVSVLRRTKGIEFFLEAAAIVSRRFADARFLVVGDSVFRQEGSQEVVGDATYRQELEAQARRFGLVGRVVFTGFRLDVREILSQSTVSVLPSITESLSNSILESMAVGLPVVATRVGGNAEAVEDGLTGLLVAPRDPIALAHAISRLLADPELASRMGEVGRQRVVDRFSVEAMVRATESVYLRLMASATERRHGRPRLRVSQVA